MAQKSIEEKITDARNAAELALLKRIKAEADLHTNGEGLANMAGAYLRFAEAVDKLKPETTQYTHCSSFSMPEPTAEDETTG